MNLGPSLIIPGTLVGSLIVASLGLMITSDVKAETLIPVTSEQATQAPSPGGLMDAAALLEPTPAPSTEELFESSIAYTPEEQPATGQDQGPTPCKVSDKFPPSILQWCDFITRYAEEHELPPNLIAAVMVQESGGKPLAYSHSGAVGLMQVMPRDGIASGFMCKNGPCFSNRPSISELQDPEFNVAYGTRMLAGLISRFGNYRDGLKSYGPMDVGHSYADKVLAIYERYGQ
jgi:hypothetical protein